MDMIDKEVNIIKAKIIKVIYIQMESSFVPGHKATKDLFTLLRALGEPKTQIDQRMMLSRAKYIKDQVQSQIVKFTNNKLESTGNQCTLLNSILFHIKLNVDEFIALKFDYEEWLIDRLQEVRAIV